MFLGLVEGEQAETNQSQPVVIAVQALLQLFGDAVVEGLNTEAQLTD